MFTIKSLPWIGDRSSAHQNTATSPAKQRADAHPPGLHTLMGNGPPRSDGSDRFYGMENVVGLGNTCYCNSILQCLYYSKPFRERVVDFPSRGQPPYQASALGDTHNSIFGRPLSRIKTETLPTTSANALAAAKVKSPLVSPSGKEDGKKKPLPMAAMVQIPISAPENKDSPDYKKKKALETGPVLDLDQGNHAAYGMEESLFTALKDIFESVMAHSSKTGVVRPNKFLEILRRENDMFNGQQHQDAHEFLNYVLNQVIENVEAHQKKLLKEGGNSQKQSGSATPAESTSSESTGTMTSATAAAGWIHDLFEGLLSSETKCLTCENVSRRNEQFMDLSIDLEKNSSVTSCLRNFSASEMLCERNKFHCDHCGGLQEAEKRMKIKRLPRVLALHLKRFKYMESTNRFEKLHYRVLYPYHLRLFNTTDDAEDPDRLYELYAVVVHIGGGPYHGHYVAIVKTEDKGWLLFDDEMVEPVDKSYVRNFFGERTGTGVASAYVLFYQETTLEAVQREMWAEEQAAEAETSTTEAAKTEPLSASLPNGINGNAVRPLTLVKDDMPTIHTVATSPFPRTQHPHEDHKTLANAAPEHPMPKSKKERERERKEEKEREKAERKVAARVAEEKEREKAERKAAARVAEEKENGIHTMSRFRTTSRSLRQPPKWLGGHHHHNKKDNHDVATYGSLDEEPPIPPHPILPTTPESPPTTNGFDVADPIALPVLMDEQKENVPPVPREDKRREKERKEREKKEKEKADHDKDRRKLHHHRPSLFGLRKKAKAQSALGAGE